MHDLFAQVWRIGISGSVHRNMTGGSGQTKAEEEVSLKMKKFLRMPVKEAGNSFRSARAEVEVMKTQAYGGREKQPDLKRERQRLRKSAGMTELEEVRKKDGAGVTRRKREEALEPQYAEIMAGFDSEDYRCCL